MPSLDEIARSQTSLGDGDVAWLSALTQSWHILADLSFSDLVVWLVDAESKGFWAAAQIRPTTGPTTLLEDVAGSFVPAARAPLLRRAAASPDAVSDVDGGVRIETIGLRLRGSLVAVLARRWLDAFGRATSPLEAAYESAARAIMSMMAVGEFPTTRSEWSAVHSLRVGDGFIRTDRTGEVTYASPNAMSAYRRLGFKSDLSGADLGEVTTQLVDRRPTQRAPLSLFGSGVPTEARLENAAAALLAQVIPLREDNVAAGSVVLLRDVTELRSRERELVTKEATIREIHHRVKNNLQTVAALLRLQARRSQLPEAKVALADAERRVATIALVHETLSGSFDDFVDFDVVVDDLLRSVVDLEAVGSPTAIKTTRIGQFGTLPGRVATPLAMVITELLQNAVHHARDDEDDRRAHLRVAVAVNRIRHRLRLRVSDDGRGLAPDFDPGRSLGLSIVTTLVESELGGTLSFDSDGRGTTVTVVLQLS